jgi:hypothetical protein
MAPSDDWQLTANRLCELCEDFASLRETGLVKDGSRKGRKAAAKTAMIFLF